MAQPSRYSTLQIGLHWLIAVLIALAYIISDGMGEALRNRVQTGATGIEGNTIHVWIGSAIFFLVLLRIAVRLIQGAPAPEPGTSERMEKLAGWGHRALYVLMVLVPVLGGLAWYVQVPLAGDAHEVTTNLIMLVAGGHALAALYHHYRVGDGTLRRMLRPTR